MKYCYKNMINVLIDCNNERSMERRAAYTREGRTEKIHALSLENECYSMKLDLVTNATVIDDAIRL